MCIYACACERAQDVVTSMACSDKFLVRSAPAPDTVTEVRGESGEGGDWRGGEVGGDV